MFVICIANIKMSAVNLFCLNSELACDLGPQVQEFTCSYAAAKFESLPVKKKVIIRFGTRCCEVIDGQQYCIGEPGLCLVIIVEELPDPEPVEAYINTGTNVGVAEITIKRIANKKNGNSVLGTNMLQWTILEDNAEINYGSTFYVMEDVELNNSLSQSLGFSRVIIKQGVYQLDRSKYQYGRVLLSIETY